MRQGRWLFAAVASTLSVALALWYVDRQPGETISSEPPIEQHARQFVTLGLALGLHSPTEVDSYFGPATLQPSPTAPHRSLATLQADVAQLQRDLVAPNPDKRRRRLQERTRRMAVLVEQLQPSVRLPFDQEARELYGLEPLAPDTPRFIQARHALDRLLPGTGSLTSRVQAYRERFVVPERLRPALFSRALAECRTRTLQHWKLPPSERLDVEWTSDVGAAWHRYQGAFHSVLQVNPQAVAFLDSMVSVACHEGYPGHHVQFVMAEAAAGRLPVEDRMVLLRSPGSVIREGAADYGVSLVFPAADRLAFERDVLFPMGGFPPEEAARYEQVRSLVDQLAPAALPILRAYRDQTVSAEAAAAALDQAALITSPQALLGFVDSYGAYVSGYTGVREQVRGIVDGTGTIADQARWARLRRLLQLADEEPLSQAGDTIERESRLASTTTRQPKGIRP